MKPNPKAKIFTFGNGSKYWVWEENGHSNWVPISPGPNGEWDTGAKQ